MIRRALGAMLRKLRGESRPIGYRFLGVRELPNGRKVPEAVNLERRANQKFRDEHAVSARQFKRVRKAAKRGSNAASS